MDRRGAGQTSTPDLIAEPEALVVTHYFDPGRDGEPYEATIRLRGRRAGVSGAPRPTDMFVREETIGRIVPGSGPVSVSSWVYGLSPGEWSVTAEIIRPRADARGHRMAGAARPDVQPLRIASWSWLSWSVQPRSTTRLVKTRWAILAPLARIPAVLPGTIPAFVTIGALIALSLQAMLVGGRGISVGDAFLVSAIACVSGFIAAKLWYARLNPSERLLKPGWAVDGFMVVAPLAAIAALIALRIPVAAYLDATTPGLFFTVALGRLGCFLTGCCAGRVTSSRLGVWCSDQRIGTRRVPTQLIESVTGLVLGIVSLALALGTGLVGTGILFVAAFSVYLIVRQNLLRLRAQPRRFLWQRRRLEQRAA